MKRKITLTAPQKHAGILTLTTLLDTNTPRCEIERVALTYDDFIEQPGYAGYLERYCLHRWRAVVRVESKNIEVVGYASDDIEPPVRWYLERDGESGRRGDGGRGRAVEPATSNQQPATQEPS